MAADKSDALPHESHSLKQHRSIKHDHIDSRKLLEDMKDNARDNWWPISSLGQLPKRVLNPIGNFSGSNDSFKPFVNIVYTPDLLILQWLRSTVIFACSFLTHLV